MADYGRIACIVNPVRPKSERAWQLVQQHCTALGLTPPRRYDTTIEHPGGQQTREAMNAGARHVIGIGGDGTLRNISNELAGTGVSLGIIPTGTANIFHLNAVGTGRKLDRAVRTALLGDLHAVDLGRVNLTFGDERGDWSGRFLVVVGVGRDAISIGDVSPDLKRLIGPGAYFAAGARQIFQPHLPMRVEIDGEQLSEEHAWSVLVGNCGRVPGRIAVLPSALVDDGLLNVMRIAPRGKAAWIPVALRGLRGGTRSLAALHEFTVRHVTIIPEQPTAVQVDGDMWGNVVKVDIQIEPEALLVRSRSQQRNVERAHRGPDQSTHSGLDRPQG